MVGEPSFLKLYHGCFLFCFVFLTSLSVTFLCYSAFILATHGPRVAELPIAGSNAGARGTNKTTCSSQIPQLSSPSIAHLCTSVCKWWLGCPELIWLLGCTHSGSNKMKISSSASQNWAVVQKVTSSVRWQQSSWLLPALSSDHQPPDPELQHFRNCPKSSGSESSLHFNNIPRYSADNSGI